MSKSIWMKQTQKVTKTQRKNNEIPFGKLNMESLSECNMHTIPLRSLQD